MTTLNRNLAIAAALLLVASVFTYWNSITRAERFERGQKFLPNLNPDEIAALAISKGEEKVHLKRQGDEYIVEEANGYLAKNEAVNRFVRDLLDLSLEREVGASEKLAAELEIEPPGEETVEVTLRNANNKDMVRLRVGKRFEDGVGSYVRRLDDEEAPIYLTSKSVYLNTGKDSFLKKEIVDVPSSDIARIEGPDFVFAKQDEGGTLALESIPTGRKTKDVEASRVKNALSRLSFDKVYVADDPEVRDLAFSQALRVDLDDQTGYVLATATKDDRTFLRISGFLSVDRLEINPEETDEELQEKADILNKRDELKKFNDFHGSWVYEIPKSTAEKLQLHRSDLLEAET